MKSYKKYLQYAMTIVLLVHILFFPVGDIRFSRIEGYSQVNYSDQISPRAKTTVWIHRVYNGKEQMRLWSYTEGRWLTDWIDC